METEVWTLNWSNDLCVGIPEIDREHQRFVVLVNELNQAIVDRMDLAEIRKRLQSLLDNAKADAIAEDHILIRENSPEATDHMQSHQIIDSRIREVMGKLNESSTLYAWIDSSLKIKKILITHFLSEDMKLRAYCRS